MQKIVAACAASVLLAVGLPLAAKAAAPAAETVTLTNPDDGQKIVISVFQPEGATADAQVPVILESHGWGGSRRTETNRGPVDAFLKAGMGVVSIDQRGHGASGGQAHVQDPTRETEDIKMVIDYIATLPWVQHDTDDSGNPIPNDPVLGAIGGSYGGGYQTMTTLDEIADEGRTRMNALAPEITWYDLPESLAPQGVPRTAWTALLYAAGARMLPPYVHQGQAWGTTTGQWPDGTLFGQAAPGVPNLDAEFHEHGPIAFAERGTKIDIPVLIRQGTSDNLFNLNQGLDIFHKALTDEAREQSYFVAFNGGHALPNVLPAGTASGSDTCSGEAWTDLRIEFFRGAFAGSTAGLFPSQYNLTTADGATCLRADRLVDAQEVAVQVPNGGIVTTAAGTPQHIEVAQGPVTVAGVPRLTGELDSVGLDARAFFGLSIGTSASDARVIQNNLLPLRQPLPATGQAFGIELPGVVVTVPEGQKLFLTISPISDMYFAHGSRTPGALILNDLSLTLPAAVQDAEEVEPSASSMSLRYEGRGSSTQLVAQLTDAQTGAPVSGATIEFFGDGVSLGSQLTDTDGVAKLPLEGRYRGGHHTFESVFTGNADYSGTSASTST